MKDAQIKFERYDFKSETPQTIPASATEDKIWMITDSSQWNKKLDNRKIQQQIREELTEKFSSIYFMSATSVYFYFTDAADEALFIFNYLGDGFKI